MPLSFSRVVLYPGRSRLFSRGDKSESNHQMRLLGSSSGGGGGDAEDDGRRISIVKTVKPYRDSAELQRL